MGEEEFSIPEEYLVYIKQALDVLKVAASATGRGIISSAQWSVVVAIGFVAGIALYAMLLAGTGFALKTVLKKRKLYIEQTLPASQAKAERQASRVASRLKASGSMRKSAPASQVNLGNAPAAAAASAGTAAAAAGAGDAAPAVAAARAAPAAPAPVAVPAPAAASTTSDDSLAAAVARIASEQQALKRKVA